MKFIHVADLHLGKMVKEFSMLEEQENALGQIIKAVYDEKPDAVFIAGDVYDKSSPRAEAVAMFDRFLTELAELGVQVFVISGNHDSPEGIAFGSQLMDMSGVHMSPVYDGTLKKYTLNDEYGEVDIYMLPFVRPASVRPFFEGKTISNHNDAVRAAIDAADIDFENRRNIIISHQFVRGGSVCESERVFAGGLDNVDAEVYMPFDYAALGHLHGPQRVGAEHIRYSGTPVKYSFSEIYHKKSITIGTLGKKGELELCEIPFVPIHDLREIKGSFDELIKEPSEDYLHIMLTDEERIPDAAAQLRNYFPNFMGIDHVGLSKSGKSIELDIKAYESSTPEEIFAMFYESETGEKLSEEQASIVKTIADELWGESV